MGEYGVIDKWHREGFFRGGTSDKLRRVERDNRAVVSQLERSRRCGVGIVVLDREGFAEVR